MKASAVSACPPSRTGWTKASPTKPPIGSTSSLITVAASGRLQVTSRLRRDVQQGGEEIEAQALEQLAERALAHVDDVFKAAIDQDEQQEKQRQREEIGSSVECEAGEKLALAAAEPGRHGNRDMEQPGGRGLPSGRPGPWIASVMMYLGRSSDR